MRQTIFTLLFSALFFSAIAAPFQLSPAAKISLITCGPGEELYSTFGHSAVRVCDEGLGMDVVFNYGTFDFSDPNFYTNFVRGKLNYKLAVGDFQRFMYMYMMDDRWVAEQTLNIDSLQRQQLFDFLAINSYPENCYYLYDFLFDNCATRIRDAFENVFSNQLVLKGEYMEGKPTFRNLIYHNLEDMPWSKFGIDLLLTHSIDRPATPYEYMFLPNYLMSTVGTATLNGKPFVAERVYLYQSKEPVISHSLLFTPVVVFWMLFAAVVVLSLLRVRLRWFDISFFFMLGLFGLLFLFMWFGTDHRFTNGNLHLLWALPTHVVCAFYLLKKQRPKWLQYYFLLAGILAALLVVGWYMLPQQLNIAMLPILLLVVFRSAVVAGKSFCKTNKINISK